MKLCHFCDAPMDTKAGYLVCPHCDAACTVSTTQKRCPRCVLVDKRGAS